MTARCSGVMLSGVMSLFTNSARSAIAASLIFAEGSASNAPRPVVPGGVSAAYVRFHKWPASGLKAVTGFVSSADDRGVRENAVIAVTRKRPREAMRCFIRCSLEGWLVRVAKEKGGVA